MFFFIFVLISVSIVLLFLSASVAWSLHRNLGFPLDLIDLMLEEKGKMVDKKEMAVLEDEYERVLVIAFCFP